MQLKPNYMKKIYLTIIALITTLAVSAQVPVTQMEYVDLDLPSGTLWATCNVGADSPEQIGTFFAWGETEPKDEYELGNYKWMTKAPASEFQYEKYTCADGRTSASWYFGNSFIGDGKTELELEDDAATANCGRGWCAPSYEQIRELTSSFNTTSEWTTLNDVKGWKITSKSNGKSIFIPANLALSQNDDPHGFYWSRSLNTENSTQAWYMFFNSSNIGAWHEGVRYSGFCVRPVRTYTLRPVEAIDLGLPSGTLWANCNVGANAPEEYGDYFAWGETKPKSTFNWANYKWCDSEKAKLELTKYCNNERYGTVDNKTELDPDDDAATVNWGSNWRMPSSEQMKELLEYTTYEWVTQNGVYGNLMTSKINGNSIFLPTRDWSNGDIYSYFWSRSLDTDNSQNACILYSFWGLMNRENHPRYCGYNVRPVCLKATTSINSVTANQKATKRGKYISGGNLVIEKDGKQYNVIGIKVK